MTKKVMETENPIEALKAPSVHVRAAATRDLEKYGELDVLEVLVHHAQEDPSPAIRHNAADALSDILSRYRVPPNDSLLPEERRREILSLIYKISSGKNNAVFLIYASLGLPECLQKIISGFRDPRSEVRLGASVGLLRYCQSISTLGDENIENQVTQLLQDRNLEADALAHIARVCAAVGYQKALPMLRRIDMEGAHGETINAAHDKLRSQQQPPYGIWASDGCDAGEFNVDPSHSAAYCVITPEGRVIWTEDVQEWQFQDEDNGHHRLMWFRRVGEPTPGPSLQFANRTWHMATKVDIDVILKSVAELSTSDLQPAFAVLAAGIIHRGLHNDSKGWRDIGVLWMRAHRYQEAIDAFEMSLDEKRTPIDVWFYLGESHYALGQLPEAKKSWENCLQKTRTTTSALAHLCQSRMDEVFSQE